MYGTEDFYYAYLDDVDEETLFRQSVTLKT